jgi:hypothetical protein
MSPEPQAISGSLVSSHSRQIQSPARSSRALREAGTIVTPQVAQIGGRSSSTPEVCVVSEVQASRVGQCSGMSPEDVALLGTACRGESARWPRKEMLR